MQVNERQVRFQPIEILIENQHELDCLVGIIGLFKSYIPSPQSTRVKEYNNELKFIKELEDKLPLF